MIMQLPPLGLGTVKFGRNTQVKYPKFFELPSDTAIIDLLTNAQELGVNLIDTAPAYGSSEIRLGNLLPRVAPRKQWIICGKTGENFTNNISSFNFTRDAIIASVHASLSNLKTDYLDILLIHSNGADLEIIEQFDIFATLDYLKQDGQI
ncbi:MAG: aldo/keto reductase, partial [Thiotrichales bacterium]